MPAKEFTCRVLESMWITPTVVRIRFEPLKLFSFEPGQFLSLVVPPNDTNPTAVKRCYSFASSPLEAKKYGYYELCVKYVPGGQGTSYLASLGEGDTFRIFAAYGDFRYRVPTAGRSVCFICTSTGMAPFRSIAFSQPFKENPPETSLCLLGVRTEDEILYKGDMESMGIETVYAVSKPNPGFKGHAGRVTDYLKSLPTSWVWHTTDFYLCGNGEMVTEVSNLLRGGYGVPEKSIHKEAFSLVLPGRKAGGLKRAG